MKTTIVRNTASAKKNNVRCCHCSSQLIIRNGTYARNDPQSDRQIRVQRYLCKSPKCPWISFSALPPPILPVVRHTYKTLFDSYAMFGHGLSHAIIARQMGITRGVVKRLETVCGKFMAWFKWEQTIADWGASPLKAWQDFTRDFSQYFFPGKWRKAPSTQHIPLY